MAELVVADLVYARLAGDPAILALVQAPGQPARVYPLAAPEDAPFPYLVYFSIGGVPESTMGLATPELDSPEFQVSCFSSSYHQAKLLQRLVRARLRGYADPATSPPILGVLVRGDGPDLYEERTMVFHASTDFAVWTLEG